MIDVKQAVKIAIEYVQQLYEPEQLRDLALEEVELSEDGTIWKVTLGFNGLYNEPANAFTALAYERMALSTRAYKVFHIRASDGAVLSMRMRTFSPA
jgi:hypothetical protein